MKFTRQRSKLTPLALRHLSDKSASVRRYAIALVTKLVVTHPFGLMYGGDLNRDKWEGRLEEVRRELEALESRLQEEEVMPEGMGGAFGAESGEEGEDNDEEKDQEMDEDEDDEGGSKRVKKEKVVRQQSQRSAHQQPPVDNNLVLQHRMSHDYHSEALRFVLQVENAIPKLNELLTSTGRAEVLEAMDFFKVAHEYEFVGSKVGLQYILSHLAAMQIHSDADYVLCYLMAVHKIGIKTMLHLIWTKDNNAVSEEGKELKGIRARVIECYKSLYFDAVPGMTPKQQVSRITKNMIE